MADEPKKKHHTSTAVKLRYNRKMYSQISCLLPKQLVADFKATCKEHGDPQAQVIRRALEEYIKSKAEKVQ